MSTSIPSQATGLSWAKEMLVEMIGALGFGRVENLAFQNGEPLLDGPQLRIIRTIRFGGGEAPLPTPSLTELATRPAVRQLMRQMDRLRDGVFTRIEVRSSSPVFCELELGSKDGEVAHD
jgi:hypothetical protein